MFPKMFNVIILAAVLGQSYCTDKYQVHLKYDWEIESSLYKMIFKS